MNQRIFLTKNAFNSLLANLLEIEEGTNEIINVFFLGPSKEADELKRVLNDYVRRLDVIISNITTVETAADDFPYVIVGSEVVIEDIGSHVTYLYELVSPLKNKINSHEISFLSPMGKALLLKEVNDNFVVEAPGGSFDYKVLSVRIAIDSQRSMTNLIG